MESHESEQSSPKKPFLYWNPPANEEEVGRLKAKFPYLPESYLNFLRKHNGGEVSLGAFPRRCVLWDCETLMKLNPMDEAYELEDYFTFGSNGATEGLLVELEDGVCQSIYSAYNLNVETMRLVAPSFEAFIELIGK